MITSKMKTTKEKSRTSVPVSYLPPEMYTEFLSRLSVKSLIRLRLTTKSLGSLIDSPYFINFHLKKSLNFKLILQRQSKLYLFDLRKLTFVSRIILPFIYATPRIRLLGSCNGLLCILHYSGEISFLNPSTRLLCDIPNFPIPSCHESCIIRNIYGFGFDSVSGDYKLLRIIYIVNVKDLTFDSEVRLFIPRTNSWKVLLSFPYAPHFCIRYGGECDLRYHNYPQTIGVLVDNHLHWPLAREFTEFEPQLVVVAFNLTLEDFNEIPLPEIREVSKNGFGISVSDLGGCLCMIVSCNILKLEVWVMKEYGSRDSWCKLFTLGEQCLIMPVASLRPLSYSSDGSKVLLEYIGHRRMLVWYDLKSEYFSSVEGIPTFNEAIICVESLLQPSFMFPEEPAIYCSSCLW